MNSAKTVMIYLTTLGECCCLKLGNFVFKLRIFFLELQNARLQRRVLLLERLLGVESSSEDVINSGAGIDVVNSHKDSMPAGQIKNKSKEKKTTKLEESA